jgi:hypothetical protein
MAEILPDGALVTAGALQRQRTFAVRAGFLVVRSRITHSVVRFLRGIRVRAARFLVVCAEMPETVQKNKASQCGLSRLPVKYCSMYHISRAQCQIQFALGKGIERGDFRVRPCGARSAGLVYLA